MLAGLQKDANHSECGVSRTCGLELLGWLWSPGRLQNQLELGKLNRAGREQLAESRAWVKRTQKLSCWFVTGPEAKVSE